MERHKWDVSHYLGIYKLRKKMQDNGTTNPSPEIKKFTRELVEKLSTMPLDEEITLEESTFYDSKGNLILETPRAKDQSNEPKD